ncbi:hypothetical protein HAX54_012818, partial [Datura stramonium]|nr:hypothetical protein [Datura stramonium]
YMVESYQDTSGNASLPYGMIVSRIINSMGVDVSAFPVKEISSTYNDRAFSSMGYILDENRLVKKESFKPKGMFSTLESCTIVPPDGSSSFVFSSLMIEIKDVKETQGAVAGDMHKSNKSLTVLISSVVNMKTKLILLQHEGVKSFNKVLRQVYSATTQVEVSDNELAVAIPNSYSSLSTRI